ncbi:MAG: hypothetical protein PVI55_03915 [Desulfobacterales bacterium]
MLHVIRIPHFCPANVPQQFKYSAEYVKDIRHLMTPCCRRTSYRNPTVSVAVILFDGNELLLNKTKKLFTTAL